MRSALFLQCRLAPACALACKGILPQQPSSASSLGSAPQHISLAKASMPSMPRRPSRLQGGAEALGAGSATAAPGARHLSRPASLGSPAPSSAQRSASRTCGAAPGPGVPLPPGSLLLDGDVSPHPRHTARSANRACDGSPRSLLTPRNIHRENLFGEEEPATPPGPWRTP